jgi:2-methylcitrate dehydratase PrpD
MSVTRTAMTRELASFLARLRYEGVPDGAVERTKELFLDWFGSVFHPATGAPGSELIAACRHTHPAADALLKGMEERGLTADDIASVRARVHAAAIDVLGPVIDPRTIHQSKFSMGFVLALVATKGRAGIDDFTEEALEDAELHAFSEKVEMVLDKEVDAAYPRRWIGVVEIETSDGERFISRVEVPKGDPGNTLSRRELEEKARNLAAYGGGASGEETDVRDLLPKSSA